MCASIPTGAEIRIDEQACQRCGACSGVCPTSSIERAFLPPCEFIDVVLDAAPVGGSPVIAITCFHSQDRVSEAVGARHTVVTPSLLILDETYLLGALAGGARGMLLVGCPRCTHDEPTSLMGPLSVTRPLIDDPVPEV